MAALRRHRLRPTASVTVFSSPLACCCGSEATDWSLGRERAEFGYAALIIATIPIWVALMDAIVDRRTPPPLLIFSLDRLGRDRRLEAPHLWKAMRDLAARCAVAGAVLLGVGQRPATPASGGRGASGQRRLPTVVRVGWILRRGAARSRAASGAYAGGDAGLGLSGDHGFRRSVLVLCRRPAPAADADRGDLCLRQPGHRRLTRGGHPERGDYDRHHRRHGPGPARWPEFSGRRTGRLRRRSTAKRPRWRQTLPRGRRSRELVSADDLRNTVD